MPSELQDYWLGGGTEQEHREKAHRWTGRKAAHHHRTDQRDHEERSARALAALTVDEMDGIARAAMQERFGLTGQQLEKLDYVEESCSIA